MGTLTAVYVESEDIDRFGAALRLFLEDSHPNETLVSETDTRMPIYGEVFRLFIDNPTAFAYARGSANWCTAHFNCFAHLESFADSLSTSLNAQVVVLNIQTVSSCYYVSVHRGGQRIRAFDFQDGECVTDVGTPLEFESEDLPDAEKFGCDFDDYCVALGLPIGAIDNYADEWTLIQLANQPSKRKFKSRSESRKPWWQRIMGGR